MKFNSANQISGLFNYTDIVPAVQALGGRSAVLTPMLPPDLLPGEREVSDAAAAELVHRYYAEFPAVGELVCDEVTALIPGDPRRLRFSGRWQGRREVLQMTRHLADSLQIAERSTDLVIAEQGAAVAVVKSSGIFTPTRSAFQLQAVDFFQFTAHRAGERIGRVASFLDTYLLTGMA